jgi:hypothetical protein
MEGMSRYRLFSVNYCQFITLKFIAGLLWVMGLWTVTLMPDGVLHPLILLMQSATVHRRKDTNIKTI